MIVSDQNSLHNKPFLRRTLIRGVTQALAWTLLIGPAAYAADEHSSLLISNAQDTEDLSQFIQAYEDREWNKAIEDMVGIYSGEFRPLDKSSPDFGFTKSRIWLRINLQNQSANEDRWFLHVHENFLQVYEVFIQHDDGRVERLETHGATTRFSERSIAFPELATQFDFEPGARATLYMLYWSEGSSKISLSLETEKSFSNKSLQQISKNFISYGMMLILIFASTLALILLRLKVFFAYSTYVAVTLLFLMHSDGVAFQYLWPQYPTFNSYFSIIIGLAFAIVPYNFARVFLRTQEFHPRIDRIMVIMMVLMPILVIPGAIIDPQSTKKYLMLLVLLAIAIGTFAGLVAAKARFKEVRFYLFAWIIGGLAASLMNLRHFTDLAIVQDAELDSIRIAIVIDAIMMGLGVADRYRQQVKARRQEEQRALRQAEQNLNLNNRLQALEERYTLATELVTSRNAELKNTVHDLRQPLHALRLNVKNLQTGNGTTRDQDPKFEDTFSYLETLISEFLQDSVEGLQSSGEAKLDLLPPEDAGSDLSLSKILQSIHEMFLPDAQEKGIEFRHVKTSQASTVDPFTLMRMLTNLVSNAIKYTPNGKVLLGVRRRQGGLQIEICDTGLGLSEADFIRAQSRSVRLNEQAADGHGFGLSIVRDLAKESGCELLRLNNKGLGTRIALRLPKASGR